MLSTSTRSSTSLQINMSTLRPRLAAIGRVRVQEVHRKMQVLKDKVQAVEGDVGSLLTVRPVAPLLLTIIAKALVKLLPGPFLSGSA